MHVTGRSRGEQEGPESTAPLSAISGGSMAAERLYRTPGTLAPIIPAAVAPCHNDMLLSPKIFERYKCSWWRRQQYPSDIFFNDPLRDRTSAQCAQCFHGRKPCQCTLSFRSMDTVHCVYLVYFYLPLRVSTLHFCFLLIIRSSC